MVAADGPRDAEPVYIGRLGLTDSTGRRLLVDWRSPAAEPFFGATHAQPMGLVSRRRYRWSRGRVTDYWDEVFTPDGLERPRRARRPVGVHRQPRQQPVRPDARRARHHPGRPGRHHPRGLPRHARRRRGPGTGKTVVALHRSAYLLYADPRLGAGRGSVLSSARTGPTSRTSPTCCPASARTACGPAPCVTSCRGFDGREETDPDVARLKSSADMVTAIEPAVRLYEEPPDRRDGGRHSLGRPLARRRRLGRGIRRRGAGYAAQRGRDQAWEALVPS